VIGISYIWASFVYIGTPQIAFIEQYMWMFATFCVIFVALMFCMRMYNMTTFMYMDRTISRILTSAFTPSLCIASIVFLLKIESASRLFFLLFIAISTGVLLVGRIAMVRMRPSTRNKKGAVTLFVGSPESFSKYSAYIGKTTIQCVFEASLPYGNGLIATPDKFGKYIVEHSIDEIIIVYSPDESGSFQYGDYMSVGEEMGITTSLIVDLFDMPLSQKYITSIGTLPMITYHSVPKNQMQIFFKKIFDMCGAIVAILITSPIMLVTAIAIKLDSPGPVFFRQKRVGRNGKTFDILKFRSMRAGAEALRGELECRNKFDGGLMFKIDDDPRMTRVGKFIRRFSIDELPQFINVLRGEMSIVGTRPPTVDEVSQYERSQRRRISISPGITGMWQVSGRSEITDFAQVVALDTQYIDEWSFGLDIKLLFKTVAVVFARKGAR
jgi:exopolysaccharide biosynthesis polyprenyl glycosylphosphotransferase